MLVGELKMDQDRICFIRTKLKRDYVFDGIALSGYRIIIPYKDYNLFLRLCREFWVRLKLPMKQIWYNREVKDIEQDIIIVKDPLMTADFIRYLRKNNPNSHIVLDYDNRVSNSIHPNSIGDYIDEFWSYDEDDCREYRLRYKGHSYIDIYQTKPNPTRKYDVFYVGRDKGRLDQIHQVEKKLKDLGLETYFYICADRSFLTWKKREYRPFLPYEGYLELLKDSKAILNIVPEGQRSITQREMEAVFDGVKCITNNRGILDFDLYDESRYFLLDNNYEDIPAFLNNPFKEVEAADLNKYRMVNVIDAMFQESI